MDAEKWAEQQADVLAALIEAEDLTGFRSLGMPGAFDLDYDLDTLFEFGLQLVLDGLAVRLRTAGSPLL